MGLRLGASPWGFAFGLRLRASPLGPPEATTRLRTHGRCPGSFPDSPQNTHGTPRSYLPRNTAVRRFGAFPASLVAIHLSPLPLSTVRHLWHHLRVRWQRARLCYYRLRLPSCRNHRQPCHQHPFLKQPPSQKQQNRRWRPCHAPRRRWRLRGPHTRQSLPCLCPPLGLGPLLVTPLRPTSRRLSVLSSRQLRLAHPPGARRS